MLAVQVCGYKRFGLGQQSGVPGLVQPAVNNIGVDVVGHCDCRNGRIVLATPLADLGLEFWAVVAPLGMRGIALVRVSVHDLHSGHYRFDLTSFQYGVAGRLPFYCRQLQDGFTARLPFKGSGATGRARRSLFGMGGMFQMGHRDLLLGAAEVATELARKRLRNLQTSVQ